MGMSAERPLKDHCQLHGSQKSQKIPSLSRSEIYLFSSIVNLITSVFTAVTGIGCLLMPDQAWSARERPGDDGPSELRIFGGALTCLAIIGVLTSAVSFWARRLVEANLKEEGENTQKDQQEMQNML